jgi:hypothetical protein
MRTIVGSTGVERLEGVPARWAGCAPVRPAWHVWKTFARTGRQICSCLEKASRTRKRTIVGNTVERLEGVPARWRVALRDRRGTSGKRSRAQERELCSFARGAL